MDSLPGSLSRSTELSESAVRTIADAVAERTLVQHKQLLSYLNDRHREMLRIIKGDIREEGKRLQLVFDAQVSLCSTSLLLSRGACCLVHLHESNIMGLTGVHCLHVHGGDIYSTPSGLTPAPPALLLRFGFIAYMGCKVIAACR